MKGPRRRVYGLLMCGLGGLGTAALAAATVLPTGVASLAQPPLTIAWGSPTAWLVERTVWVAVVVGLAIVLALGTYHATRRRSWQVALFVLAFEGGLGLLTPALIEARAAGQPAQLAPLLVTIAMIPIAILAWRGLSGMVVRMVDGHRETWRVSSGAGAGLGASAGATGQAPAARDAIAKLRGSSGGQPVTRRAAAAGTGRPSRSPADPLPVDATPHFGAAGRRV